MHDDLDDIGFDVKGRPDANPLAIVVIVVLCVFVFIHFADKHKAAKDTPRPAAATAAQIDKIQRQLNTIQQEVNQLKDQQGR